VTAVTTTAEITGEHVDVDGNLSQLYPEGYWALRKTPAHIQFRQARDLLLRHRSDHDTAYRQFQWPRFSEFNWALEWFDVIAERNDTPALSLLDGHGRAHEISFAQMSARSDTVAVWLNRLGVRRGQRVLIVLGQQAELWECLLACLKIGAVVVPTYPELTGVEAADRVDRGHIEHIICRTDQAEVFTGLDSVRTRIAVPGDLDGWIDYRDSLEVTDRFVPEWPTGAQEAAFCYFTSGTTSAPKLVAHTHTSYPVGHLSSLYWNGLVPGDRHLNVSTPGWAKHSWSSFFVPWNAEATILALPPGPPPYARLPELLAIHHANTMCAPPSVWRAMSPHLHLATPALREALSAGEPLDPQLGVRVTQHWGVRVRDGYGQTETTGLVGTTVGLPSRAGWLGKALPGYRIEVRDPDTGGRLTAGEVGEVCVELADAPVGMTTGYLGDTQRTQQALGGGHYRTGDLGERDEHGWIRIHGRNDDVFKVFDHRVSPYELEAVLLRHPAVADAAVIPRPHPLAGNAPHAVVVTAAGHEPGPELAEVLLDHVADYVTDALRVRSLEFTPALPHTTSGKLRRSALRAS
jgi:acetyl-CoA synthetase